ncbi:MAG: hypothetical protein OEQ18_15750 [Gammaproteobacteria bacterium]|nr:hypothetical protein [Gammaproteobacteria bacterium]
MDTKKSRLVTELTDDAAEKVVGGAAGEGAPDFANTWHGFGSDHQANNDPGDTASDRHGFDGATAGGSDQNPTKGSNG